MSRQLYDAVRKKDGWFVFLSVFDRADWARDNVHTALYVIMETDGEIYLSLVGDEDRDEEAYPPLMTDASQFRPETWHTVAVEIDASGLASLYLDEKVVTRGNLLAPSRNGVEYVHAGPICAAAPLSKNGYVLVDNFQFTCWSD